MDSTENSGLPCFKKHSYGNIEVYYEPSLTEDIYTHLFEQGNQILPHLPFPVIEFRGKHILICETIRELHGLDMGQPVSEETLEEIAKTILQYDYPSAYFTDDEQVKIFVAPVVTN